MCVPLLGLARTYSSWVQPQLNPLTGWGWLLDTREDQLSRAPGSGLQKEIASQLGPWLAAPALIKISPQRSQQRQEVPSVHLPCPDVRLD